MSRARPWLLAALLGLVGLPAGCRYATYTAGEDRFLRRKVDLRLGTTTVADVASALGPPDQVLTRDGELVFFYGYQERVDRSIVLRYFAAAWFSGSISSVVDRGLLLVFDRDWRLKLASSQASQLGDQ